MRRKRAYEPCSVAVLYRNYGRIIKREASAFYIHILLLCTHHYRTLARVVGTLFYKKICVHTFRLLYQLTYRILILKTHT